MNDLQDRIETWFCSGREGFVEAFATHSRVFGNLCHATGFHHIADSAKKLLVVTVCEYLRQVLANGFITVEQRRHVEIRCQDCGHSTHPSFVAGYRGTQKTKGSRDAQAWFLWERVCS
ncbi:hypothetical protein D9M72_605680 [compost metagenome]